MFVLGISRGRATSHNIYQVVINAKMVRWVTIGASEEEGAIAQEPAENMLDIVTKFCYQ